MGSSVKGAARAKRKSGCIVRQSDTEAGGCYGNRMASSGVVKDEIYEELNPASSAAASVTSLRELELAAAAGRTSNGKLDNVKARLNRSAVVLH